MRAKYFIYIVLKLYYSGMATLSKPNEQQVVKFWQLILETPTNQNPMTDSSGGLSLHGQDPSNNPLYLSGNTGGNNTRNIPNPIPSGREIFIAVNPVVVTEVEAKAKNTSADLRKLASDDEDSATKANLTINGEVHDLKTLNFRVPTEPFNVTLPPEALWGASPPGTSKAVADGYYAITNALTPGNYKIDIDAEVSNSFEKSAPWQSKVTYNFKVV